MSEAVETADPLLARIDHLTELLELALSPQLKARRADPIDTVILSREGRSVRRGGSARLFADAAPRTLQKRLAALIEAGHVEHRGGRRYAEYRSSGLI